MEQFLVRKGLKFVARNYKTPFAEVDLVFQEESGVLHVIEVKTTASSWRPPISEKQKQRLRNAHTYFTEKGYRVRSHLCMVRGSQLDWVKDFL